MINWFPRLGVTASANVGSHRTTTATHPPCTHMHTHAYITRTHSLIEFKIETRMHSGRMHTARSSSHLGEGLHQAPRDQAPLPPGSRHPNREQAPPGPGNPQEQAPPPGAGTPPRACTPFPGAGTPCGQNHRLL